MPSRRDFHRFPILYTLVGKIAPITKKGVEMELPQEGTHASSRSVLQCFHVRTCFSISIQCLDDSNSNALSIPMRNLPINHRIDQPTNHPPFASIVPRFLEISRCPCCCRRLEKQLKEKREELGKLAEQELPQAQTHPMP